MSNCCAQRVSRMCNKAIFEFHSNTISWYLQQVYHVPSYSNSMLESRMLETILSGNLPSIAWNSCRNLGVSQAIFCRTTAPISRTFFLRQRSESGDIRWIQAFCSAFQQNGTSCLPCRFAKMLRIFFAAPSYWDAAPKSCGPVFFCILKRASIASVN